MTLKDRLIILVCGLITIVLLMGVFMDFGGSTNRHPFQTHITLTSTNSVVFNEEVTAISCGEALLKLQKLIKPGVKELYLVLDTPGGSVLDGSLFIDAVRSLPVKVHTITIFAASMGYQMVQGFNDRYILETGTLMSHRANGGQKGDIYGNLDSRLNWIKQVITVMDNRAANRLNISLEEYREQIRDELWIVGQYAVESKNADSVVNVVCDGTLSGTHNKIFQTIFGKVTVEFSDCPLITAPLKITSETKEALNVFNRKLKEKEERSEGAK